MMKAAANQSGGESNGKDKMNAQYLRPTVGRDARGTGDVTGGLLVVMSIAAANWEKPVNGSG